MGCFVSTFVYLSYGNILEAIQVLYCATLLIRIEWTQVRYNYHGSLKHRLQANFLNVHVKMGAKSSLRSDYQEIVAYNTTTHEQTC